jgi:hypothetical protein
MYLQLKFRYNVTLCMCVFVPRSIGPIVKFELGSSLFESVQFVPFESRNYTKLSDRSYVVDKWDHIKQLCWLSMSDNSGRRTSAYMALQDSSEWIILSDSLDIKVAGGRDRLKWQDWPWNRVLIVIDFKLTARSYWLSATNIHKY